MFRAISAGHGRPRWAAGSMLGITSLSPFSRQAANSASGVDQGDNDLPAQQQYLSLTSCDALDNYGPPSPAIQT